MKRKTFVAIAIAVAIVALVSVAVNRIAEKEIRHSMANAPGAKVNAGKVHFSLLKGTLEMKDLELTMQDSTGKFPDVHGTIEALKLKKLRWIGLFQHQAVFSELEVENGAIGLNGTKGGPKGTARISHLSVRETGYSFRDSVVMYNDSLYSFSIDSLDMTAPDGLSRIQIGHLEQADAGPVKAQVLHLFSTAPMEKTAKRLGNLAAIWFNIKLDSLSTSPIHFSRMMADKHVAIESIRLSGPEAVICQDDRLPPASPYSTIQEFFNTWDFPMRIGQLNARFDAGSFIWQTTHVNRGLLPLQNLKVTVNSISNTPGNVMDVALNTGLPGKSRMNFSLHIHNNHEESTSGKYQIRNLDASKMDGFFRPLFGATVRADIHQIDGQFQGNKNKLDTQFCMLYDNLEVHAWDDSSAPFRIVADNTGIVNFLANLLLPHANPLQPGKEPKKVKYKSERDVRHSYPEYIIRSMLSGAMHTVLPGSRIHEMGK